MATLTLQYGPAIQESLKFAKNVKDVELELAKLQARLSNLSAASAKGILVPDLEIVKANVKDMQMMLVSGQKLQEADLTRFATAKRYVDLQTPLIASKKAELELTKQVNAEGQKGQSFWEHRFGWFLSGTLFYGSLKLAKDVIKNMVDIESQMTTIRRVSSESTADFGAMRNALLDLGVRYGQTWGDVSDIAIRWAQAGHNVADTIKLTEISLLALNTAELNASQSTSGFISILAQWGMTADQLLPVLDKVNKVADSYAVTSADLIDGLSRSSGAAKMLGLSLEDVIAMLTVMREATGRSGREIGSALNSIMAFMQRPTAIKAFKVEGIDATMTKTRSLMDVFGELASRWASMSTVAQEPFIAAAEAAGLYSEEVAVAAGAEEQFTLAQQQNISQSAAGVYRRNYFLALMTNWAKIDDVLITLETALGYSQDENTKRMATQEAKVKALTAAWQQFSTAFTQAGILGILKGLADGGRITLEIFNGFPPAIKAAVGGLITWGVVLTALNSAMRIFAGQTLGSFLGGLAGAGQIGFLAAGGSALSTVLPWIPAVIAGTGIIAGLVRQQVEENRQLNVLADSYTKATSNLSKYGEGTEEYSKASETMQTVMNAIGEKFPDLITGMDQFGNVTGIATDRLGEFAAKTPGIEQMRDRLQEVKDRMAEIEAILADIETKRYTLPQGEMPGDIPGGIPVPSITTYYDETGLKREYLGLGKERGTLEKTPGVGGGTAVPEGITFALDDWRNRLDEVTQSYASLDLALISAQENVRLTSLAEEHLKDEMAEGNLIREASLESTEALADENQVLTEVNGGLYDKLSQVLDLQAEARLGMGAKEGQAAKDAADAYQQAVNQVRSLTSEISSNIIKIQENKYAIESAGRSVSDYYQKMRDEAKKTYDELFNLQKSVLGHEVTMSRTNRDVEIAYNRELLEVYKDDAEKRWEIEEKLQSLYKDALDEQVDAAKQAYEDRKVALKDEMDAEIKLHQDQIDAIDALEESEEHTEAARQHGEKIKEIEKKLAYERLRTGIDHEKNKLDLTKDMDEENIRWQEQQTKWSREDEKERLQDKIDDLKTSYGDRQKELEKAWKKADEFLTGEFLTILASAAVYDSQWYQKGVDWATQLANGIKAGWTAADMEKFLASLSSQIAGANAAPAATTGTTTWQENLESYGTNKEAGLTEILRAKDVYRKKTAAGDTEGAKAAHEWANLIREKIGLPPTIDEATTGAGTGVATPGTGTLPTGPVSQGKEADLAYAKKMKELGAPEWLWSGYGLAAGGLTLRPGIFDVGEHGKERVFLPEGSMVAPLPPELVLNTDFASDLAKFASNLDKGSSMSTVYNIQTPLVTFGDLHVVDRADADYIVSTVDRHVRHLLASKGVRPGAAVV